MPVRNSLTQYDKDIIQAAGAVVSAMKVIEQGIKDLAASSGALEASLANKSEHPTLSTPEAERTFELIGALDSHYWELARHLSARGSDSLG